MTNAEMTHRFPLNLQFFAENAPEGGEPEGAPEGGEPEGPTVADLLKEIATLKADGARNKAALDKALKEKGDLTKSLRAHQSAEEQENEARKEQEEQRNAYVKELEAYKNMNEAIKRYQMQGMDAETASKAAEAELQNDMDALSDIQKQHTQKLIKDAEAQWLKTRPQPQVGTGASTMTKEQILAITDPVAQRNAIAQNLDLFK